MATITIDNQKYAYLGKVKCVQGTGDHQDEWFFDAYRAPTGEVVLSNIDQGKRYLYLGVNADASRLSIRETFETCQLESMSSPPPIDLNARPATISWARVASKFEDAPAPFTATDIVMTITAFMQKVYLSVPLMEASYGKFYSARFSAREQPRSVVAKHSPVAFQTVIELCVAVGLLLLLGWGAATGSGQAISLFWWSSAGAITLNIFTPLKSVLKDGLKLWLGAFFLHFCTYSLDVMVAGEVWDQPAAYRFEAVKAGFIVLFLIACRHLWVRGYTTLTSAGVQGGGCSSLLFVVGIFLWSSMEEYSYFPWFRWYAGAPPWGFVWLAALCYALFRCYKDYQAAPFFYSDLLIQITHIHRIVNSGIEAAQAHSEELVSLCDDVEDALELSRDHRVMALAEFGPTFGLLKQAFENLRDLEDSSEADILLIKSDLKTLADDLGELLEQLSTRDKGASLKSLRVSTFLSTYHW